MTAGQLWMNCKLREQIISISKVGGNVTRDQSSLRKVQRRKTMTYPLRVRKSIFIQCISQDLMSKVKQELTNKHDISRNMIYDVES